MLENIILTIGYIGLFFIVFSESGLLIGLVLPGDSVLFTSGILAAQGYLNYWLLAFVLFAAAVVGDNVGYSFGKYIGKKLYDRPKSFWYDPENLKRADEYFRLYGKRTLVLARFNPAIRCFAPMIAGMVKMPRREFAIYNIVGAALWCLPVMSLGYFFGNNDFVKNNFTYIILTILFFTSLPIGIPILKKIFIYIKNKK